MEEDQKFVEYVIKAIVEKPESVKTDRKVDEMGVLIELSVDPEDMGKVIGKEGKTAKALRTLLRVLGAKSNARLNLKITEPEGGKGPNKKEDETAEVKEEVKEDTKEEEKDEEKATSIL